MLFAIKHWVHGLHWWLYRELSEFTNVLKVGVVLGVDWPDQVHMVYYLTTRPVVKTRRSQVSIRSERPQMEFFWHASSHPWSLGVAEKGVGCFNSSHFWILLLDCRYKMPDRVLESGSEI